MDINRDLADPRKDMIKDEEGRYIYVDPANNKFDIDKFNRYYEQYRDRRRVEMKEKMEAKLKELNAPQPSIPVYNQSIPKILIDTKDSIFNLLDDLLQGKFTIDTLTKNNRLFFIGITLFFIGLFVYIYNILIDDKPNDIKTGGLQINHVHKIHMLE